MQSNGTHELLFFADDVDILGGRIHTVKKSTEVLVVTSLVTVLEINGDKTKYMVHVWRPACRTKSQHKDG